MTAQRHVYAELDEPVPFTLTEIGWATSRSSADRCSCCGRIVWLTVDDTRLCIRCDLLLYPSNTT